MSTEPCENFCDDGVVACWSPGGPCATTVCEFCGPCLLCANANASVSAASMTPEDTQ